MLLCWPCEVACSSTLRASSSRLATLNTFRECLAISLKYLCTCRRHVRQGSTGLMDQADSFEIPTRSHQSNERPHCPNACQRSISSARHPERAALPGHTGRAQDSPATMQAMPNISEVTASKPARETHFSPGQICTNSSMSEQASAHRKTSVAWANGLAPAAAVTAVEARCRMAKLSSTISTVIWSG